MKLNVYVASSWRNEHQPKVVDAIRSLGHSVYDFRNPRPGEHGFSWAQIDPEWESWHTGQWLAALDHPVAQYGFTSDFHAMKWADVFVLVLPSGRSAHLETGWAVGAGKIVVVLALDSQETPDLMHKMCDKIFLNLGDLAEWLGTP